MEDDQNRYKEDTKPTTNCIQVQIQVLKILHIIQKYPWITRIAQKEPKFEKIKKCLLETM